MAAEQAGAAAGMALVPKAAGVLSWVIVSVLGLVIAAFSVVLGFRVVPLAKGREHDDAINRLAAGLLCSFTLGPLTALWAISNYPWVMDPWIKILAGQPLLLVYFAAGAPFIAVTAVLGFWIVAAVMRWFAKRDGKDIGELINDAKSLKP